jgi:hypothetical protein
MSSVIEVGTKVGDWTLIQPQIPTDDWWLRSRGLADKTNTFETEELAALNAKENEKPQFRRRLVPVWAWRHEPTQHVHTAEIERDEDGNPVLNEWNQQIPLDPPSDIEPKSGADVTVTPPGERERIQTQIDKLQAQIDEIRS